MTLAHVPSLGVEQIKLAEARGRVLREDVVADRDQPPFDRSVMDGFAVLSAEIRTGATFEVSGTIAAGDRESLYTRTPATAIRISTGAPMPAGSDVVVPLEQAKVERSENQEQVTFSVGSIKPWHNVHRRGSDACAHNVVLRSGAALTPNQIGIAAIVGKTSLTVAQRPRITLLTSGDEVRPPELPTDVLGPQQIRNSNGPMLEAFFGSLGITLQSHVHVQDDPDATLAATRQALSQSDLVATTGGVSKGDRDWLPWAWAQHGLVTVVHGVRIQPGKPVLVVRPRGDPSKLVFGLPGNPVSALATAHLFLWPAIMRTMGAAMPAWRRVQLAESVKANPHRQMFRAVLLDDADRAKVIPWHGSGDLIHTAGTDGWIQMPEAESIEAGTALPFLPLVR